MILEMRQIPVTETSYPFVTAVNSCKLAEHGYVEEEFFMSGTANIYKEIAENKLEVSTPDAPYTTRLLVRRPEKKEAFSGNVIIEILNASAWFDIDRDWILMWKQIVRRGDIYIGITSKGHVVDALKKFNPERYAEINWANPTPEREGPATSTFDFHKPYELGLFWDMIVDFAKVLRTDSPLNPIRDFGKNWLYLVGWSQSGSYLSRIINTFAYLPENCADGPLFDGYMDTGSGAGNKAINSYSAGDMVLRAGKPVSSILCTKEPCIAVNTESENRSTFWYGDFDEPECKFRTWQIPCSSHDTEYTLLTYYDTLKEDLKKAGVELSWEGYIGEPMHTPYEPIFCAALEALCRWVREGIPAPHAPKIETYMTYAPTDPTNLLVANRTDALGNCLGGIRYPFADCATSVNQSYTDREDGQIQRMFGQCTPLPVEVLKGLYKNLDNYRKLCEESAERAVANGFVLEEDKQWMVDRCVEIAAKHGL